MKKESTKKEKVLTIVVVILSFIIVIGGAYFASELKYCNIEETPEVKLNQIGMAEFKKILKGNEASVVYIARPTCGYCQQQEPIVKKIVGENESLNSKLHYLNIDEITTDELNELFKIDKNLFGEDGSQFGTPTTIIVKNNKVVDSVVGLTQYEDFVNFLLENKII